MLRLSKSFLTGAAAAALLASAPALAQNGLGSRLDAQEQQLAQAENSCGPVNLAEYANLLNEAMQNKARADKLAKKGVPVDMTQVNADLAKATSMFARAQAAQARNCMMQAQQQAQQPQTNSQAGSPSDFYANGRPPIEDKRAPRPELVQTGQRFPTICSYEMMTVALDRAKCSPPSLSPFAHDALAAHNQLRSRFGAPPMQWRADLEQGATARAQQMAASHELSHAPREGRGTVRENILKAPNSYSTTQMIDLWADEANDFVPGTFPNVCKSGGECTGVYHISQMLWPTTFFVGCGEASDGAFTYTSCWYDLGGNKDGKEVGTAAAAAVGFGDWIREWGESPDYGFDGDLFVGYDLGAFRIEAEAAYKRAHADDIERSVALPGSAADNAKYDTTGTGVGDPSRFATTGKIDHDFKYGFAYRNTPVTSETAWDYGGYVDNNIWSPMNTGVLTFLILSNSVDADGNIDTITFYDPAFAETVDSVNETSYFDTGSWRRGVRVGTNIFDGFGANALFQDIGVVNFADPTDPSVETNPAPYVDTHVTPPNIELGAPKTPPTQEVDASDPKWAAIDELEAGNDPLKVQVPPDVQVADYYQQWREEYGVFRDARELNDQAAMLKSYNKLAAITRRYYDAYWYAKDHGVDIHNAYDADDLESDLHVVGQSLDQETKVDQPTLPNTEVFKPPEPTGELDPM